MTAKTIRLTMAQALVKYLCNQFTEIDGERVQLFAGVFGIFGHGNVTCFAEALEAAQDTLPTWRGQNEQSMALAAIAFAKAKRRRQLMIATSSVGPGATNMVTAAGVAHANRLPVLLISGDTSLRGAAGKYRIRSRLALDEAALDLDESLARAKPQRAAAPQADRPTGEDPLELLDLKIRAATPAKVVGLGLDSEWHGEMAILKQDGEWSYTGGFKPRRGTYTVFTRPFKIESGEIRLSGTGSVMPVLDIKSEYSRGEVTVMARLYGEATDLDLEFTSIPSMPQDEMLSWVLFGNDSSALTPLQGLKLAQVAAELIGGPSNLGKRNKITERLNVDRVELREMSNQESSTSLVVGKQLSERVYMEFIHEVGGQETNNIYVEYELTPHFTVDTTIGSRANHGIGANLKFDY